MRRQTEWPPIETSQMRKPLIVCVCPVDFNPNAQGERLQTQLVYEVSNDPASRHQQNDQWNAEEMCGDARQASLTTSHATLQSIMLSEFHIEHASSAGTANPPRKANLGTQ